MQQLVKFIMYAASAIMAYVDPFLPYLQVCLIAIILDCLSAWDLARRVAIAYPELAKGKKFTSAGMMKIIETILKISAVIWLVFMIDNTIYPWFDMYLANIVSGIFCTAQVISILENISSCNGAKWAKLLQRILVDKTKRHLDIDIEIDDFNKTKNDTEADDRTGADTH